MVDFSVISSVFHPCFSENRFGKFCQDSTIDLSCDEGVLFIKGSFYGRLEQQVCPSAEYPIGDPALSRTDCQIDTSSILSSSCNGQNSCSLENSSDTDPCPGTYKYTSVAYECRMPWWWVFAMIIKRTATSQIRERMSKSLTHRRIKKCIRAESRETSSVLFSA